MRDQYIMTQALRGDVSYIRSGTLMREHTAIPTPAIPTPVIPTPVLAAHFSQLHALAHSVVQNGKNYFVKIEKAQIRPYI